MRTGLTSAWPWMVLALAIVPAVWHAVDFEADADVEFPRVERPTFSRRPPAAYRLAEPGDTIDRVALYLSAAAVVLAGVGWLGNRRTPGPNLWPAAVPLTFLAFWQSATPGPTFDGWHGLGWREIVDPAAPRALRWVLAGSLAGLGGWLGWAVARVRGSWPELVGRGRAARALGLLGVAAGLIALRQCELPGVEPVGYWPRWAWVWGLLAFDLALIRCLPARPRESRRWLSLAACGVGWAVLVAIGLGVTWLHRPLNRFKEVVPGRIFISAMPTYRGLEVANQRHHFKTILNLFPEDLPGLRSPHQADEARFAREHGIRYVVGPTEATKSEAFLRQGLALAQNPDAWPMLVHCHACMDRTPAWLGIYRFVVEGRPLDEALRELERHRGYRPKGSVTLLYNRVLPSLAPERAASDPTARRLQEYAHGTRDPFYDQLQYEAAQANAEAARRVSRRDAPVATPTPAGSHSP